MQFLLLYYLIMGQAHMLSKLGYMLSKLGHVLSKLGHMLSKLGHVLSKPVQFTHQSKTTLRYNDPKCIIFHQLVSQSKKKKKKKNFLKILLVPNIYTIMCLSITFHLLGQN